jgi:hypothetical protein
MTNNTRRLYLALFAMGLISASNAVAGTFTFTGSALSGTFTTIPIRANSPGGNSIGTISGVVWDPTSAPSGQFANGRVFFTNREMSVAGGAQGGLYSVDASTGTVAFIGVPSNTTNTNANPSSVTINGSGSVFVGRDVSSAIFRVDNPTSGPTTTQMLGNYGTATTDDDPISISYVPSTNQIMVFDQGLDTDLTPAVSLMNSTSTSASPSYTTIWSTTQTVDNNIRGAYSAVDNHGYFAYADTPVEVSGMTSIQRLALGGTLETILLNGYTASLTIDDGIAVNPIDGSVWLPVNTGGTTRSYLRVDAAHATLQSPGVYLANVTQEFTASDLNAGQNSLAFSPDGKFLAVANPDGSDTLYLFAANVPEPTTIVLTIGGMLIAAAAARRRA